MKRLLIFAEPYGLGHIKAAENIRDAVKLKENVSVKIMSAGEMISKSLILVTAKAYDKGMELGPDIWGMVYDISRRRVSQLPKEAAYYFSKPIVRVSPLKKLIGIYRPDVIVCTHPFSAMFVASLKSNIPIVTVITDYEFHPFWVVPDVDYYITPCKDVTAGLMRYGVPEERIKEYGIPVSPAFSTLNDRAWPNDKTQVLVMGGGVGVGLGAVHRLEGLDVDITVVTGRNESMRKKLEGEYLGRQNIKVLGFVDDVPNLMASADLLISKAGGLTTSEAMAAGLPMIIPNVLPGQEEGNARYIEKNGAGKITSFNNLRSDIYDIISDRHMLRGMRTKALSLGKRDSALKAADLILSLMDPRGNTVEQGF